MEKQHGDGGLSALLCLLCAGALASCLPSGVAADFAWHPDPEAIGGKGNGNIHATSALHPHHALPPRSAPPPTAGADLPPSRAPGQQPAPHFGFPLQPTSGSAVPPSGSGGGEGYPFIGSNPTVPLPTGMTDTTTVLPMPDTGAGTATTKEVGYAASVPVPITMIAFALFFSNLFLAPSP